MIIITIRYKWIHRYSILSWQMLRAQCGVTPGGGSLITTNQNSTSHVLTAAAILRISLTAQWQHCRGTIIVRSMRQLDNSCCRPAVIGTDIWQTGASAVTTYYINSLGLSLRKTAWIHIHNYNYCSGISTQVPPEPPLPKQPFYKPLPWHSSPNKKSPYQNLLIRTAVPEVDM